MVLAPPICVVDSPEESTGFAEYEGGPIVGELSLEIEEPRDEERDDVDELLKDAELLSPELLSGEEPDCEAKPPVDISDILSGKSDPERDALPISMISTSFSLPPEQPESTQSAAAIEIAPLNLFFIVHFPNFIFIFNIYVLYN